MLLRATLTVLCSTILMLTGTWALASDKDQKIIDTFLKSVKSEPKHSPEAVKKAEELVASLRSDEEASTLTIAEALRELYPDFQKGLNALGEENLEVATGHFNPLTTSNDAYLAAEATYFLARIYLLEERFEDSVPLLESLEKKYADQSTRGGDALFLKGVALGQMLKKKEAMAAFQAFMKDYPTAPERMLLGAKRQYEQLRMIEEGTLSDAQFRMDYSRRRLALEDPGQNTQEEQKKIVNILAQLIKEAEEKECNCKGKGQGKGQKQGKPGEGEGEGKPSEGQQAGQSGGGSKGIDSDAMERLHRGGPQSPWSQLRDKDRDPVFNAIKEKFPGRYQQLIEQYYKSFQEEEES